MSHGDSVADGYGIKFKRYAAGLSDGLLYNLSDFVQMDMPGDDVAVTVGNTYEWFIDVGVGKSTGAEQAAMWCSLKTFLNFITSHFIPFVENDPAKGIKGLNNFNR
jgi:hypothetical protein